MPATSGDMLFASKVVPRSFASYLPSVTALAGKVEWRAGIPMGASVPFPAAECIHTSLQITSSPHMMTWQVLLLLLKKKQST